MKRVNERKILVVAILIFLANLASLYVMTQIDYVLGFGMMALSIIADFTFLNGVADLYDVVEKYNKEKENVSDEVYDMQSIQGSSEERRRILEHARHNSCSFKSFARNE